MSNPFAHIELNTDDPKTAKKFYKKLFDWSSEDTPEGYTMLSIKGAGKNAAGGGMQQKPMAEAPTAWLPYVTVPSVKKTLEKAKKAGAQIVLPYQDIGGMGAIGIFVDPTGASLGVWEVAKKKPARKARKAAKKATKKSTRKSR